MRLFFCVDQALILQDFHITAWDSGELGRRIRTYKPYFDYPKSWIQNEYAHMEYPNQSYCLTVQRNTPESGIQILFSIVLCSNTVEFGLL